MNNGKLFDNGGVGKLIIALSGVFGATAVISGAVGSHVLKGQIAPIDFDTFTLAVTYLLVHSAVLLSCGFALVLFEKNIWLRAASVLLFFGIVLFCGGLMAKAATGIAAFSSVAPLGGTAIIVAWLCIACSGQQIIKSYR